MKLAAVIAAHNEADTIRASLLSLLTQERRLDRIVVACDNCSDDTVAIVSSVAGVIAFETEDNTAKKPGALNQAWERYCQDVDLVICIDADTILDRAAAGDWEKEFVENPKLGGCSAKFTMLVSDDMSAWERLLVRLQRAEFSKWTDLALRRGRRTSVLAGTACCLRSSTLHAVVTHRKHHGEPPGPWTESSMVEDFELTHRLRLLGWEAKVSASVRAYTDAMTSLSSLWAQRMKWQTGTVDELLAFGINRRTLFDWWQQVQGLIALCVRMLWVALVVVAVASGRFHLHPIWLLPPLVFLANDVKQAFRIPNCRPADLVVAGLMFPQELFAFMRAGWFMLSWMKVLSGKALGFSYADPWTSQARAEEGRRANASQMRRWGSGGPSVIPAWLGQPET